MAVSQNKLQNECYNQFLNLTKLMKKEKAGILWESPGCVVKSDIAPHAWDQEPRKDQQPNGYLVLII